MAMRFATNSPISVAPPAAPHDAALARERAVEHRQAVDASLAGLDIGWSRVYSHKAEWFERGAMTR
jgi:hypothetical protein